MPNLFSAADRKNSPSAASVADRLAALLPALTVSYTTDDNGYASVAVRDLAALSANSASLGATLSGIARAVSVAGYRVVSVTYHDATVIAAPSYGIARFSATAKVGEPVSPTSAANPREYATALDAATALPAVAASLGATVAVSATVYATPSGNFTVAVVDAALSAAPSRATVVNPDSLTPTANA